MAYTTARDGRRDDSLPTVVVLSAFLWLITPHLKRDLSPGDGCHAVITTNTRVYRNVRVEDEHGEV